MSYNVKELENLSKEEQIEFLLKTLESVSCSNQDCTNDKPNGKWGVIAHKKYCDICYSREKREEEIRLKKRQQELHKLVEYYEYYLKVVDAIEDLKDELNVGKEEFKTIIEPLKLAHKEKKRSQGNSKQSAHSNKNKQPQQQQNRSQQSQEERIKVASLNKQDTLHTQQRTEENTSKKGSETRTQQRVEDNTPKKANKPQTQINKEVTTSVTQDELGKQKEIQNQPSSLEQVKEKTNLDKDPIPSPTKKQEAEEQITNTQFVTQINSKTIYGENSTDPSAKSDSSENDWSLFNQEPGGTENNEYNEYNEFNQEYNSINNSSSQDFQDIKQSSATQANSQGGVTKEPLNFTGFPGSQL